MDMAAEMLQLPQFGLIQRRAEAEWANRAIVAGLPVWLDRNQGNFHAPLQDGPACNLSHAEPADGCILTDRRKAR